MLSEVRYVPQVVPTRRPLVFWAITATAATLFVTLIVVAPLAAASGHPGFAAVIYRGFSSICHQLPERSFFIDDHKLAVCSRCTGLYAGFLFTLLIYPFVCSLRRTTPPARKWLFLAAAPLVIDFGLTFFGIWENTHASRLLTGLLLGSASVFYVMPAIMDLSLRALANRTRPEPLATFTLVTPEAVASAPSDYSAPERRI